MNFTIKIHKCKHLSVAKKEKYDNLLDIPTWKKFFDLSQKAFPKLSSAISAIFSPIGGAAALVGVTAYLTYLDSFDHALAKVNKKNEEYENHTQEVNSIESERGKILTRIKELQENENRTSEQNDELSFLERRNKLLQVEYDLAKQKQDLARKERAEAAAAALSGSGNKWYENFGLNFAAAFDDSGNGYKYVEEANKTKLEQTEELVQQRNDLENKLEAANDKIISAKLRKVNNRKLQEYEDEKKAIEGQIDNIDSIIADNKYELFELYKALFDTDEKLFPGYEEFASRIENIFPELNPENIIEESSNTSNGSPGIEDQKNSLEEYKNTVNSAVTAQSNLVSAFSSSRSAAGMNAEEINNVTNAFKDLEGFDYNRLFETTANGVGMNSAVFAEYNAQLQKEVKADFLGKIAQKQKELNKAVQDGETEDRIKSIQREIQTFELLANQYDGITSKYNNYVNAASSANSRDSFAGIAQGYEGIKSLIDQGWVSSDDVTSYLDLMLGDNWRNDFSDAKAAFTSLSKATNAAGHSLKDYMTFDKDGNLTSSGVWQFIEDMPKVMQSLDYAWKDADGKWNLDLTGEKLNDVAKAFGTTTEYVELMVKALRDAGMEDLKFSSDLGGDMSAETPPPKEDPIAAASESAAAEIESGGGKIASAMNHAAQAIMDQLLDEIESGEEVREPAKMNHAAQAIMDQLIDEMTDKRSGWQKLNDAMATLREYNTSQADEADIDLQTPDDFNVDGVVVTAKEINADNVPPVEVEVEPDQRSGWQKFKDSFAALSEYNTSPEGGQTDETITVNLEAGSLDTSGVPEPDINASLNVSSVNGIPKSVTIPATVQVTGSTGTAGRVDESGIPLVSGTMLSVAHSDGTAYNVLNYKRLSPSFAGGRVSLPRDEYALTNEIGQESIVRDGQWYMLPPGPHMEHLKKGDIVFSAKQTKDLLSFGKTNSYAKSYASSSITDDPLLIGLMSRKNNVTINQTYITGSGHNPNGGNAGNTSSNSNSNSNNSGGNNNNSNSKSDDSKLEKIDWIERAVKELERGISKLSKVAESAFKNLRTRLTASKDDIAKITEEIKLQQQASERYLKEAEAIDLTNATSASNSNSGSKIDFMQKPQTRAELQKYIKALEGGAAAVNNSLNAAASSPLNEDLKKLIREGKVDIQQYDEETRKLISDYQKWYDKSTEAADAVETLKEKLAELYKANFDTIATDFENRISVLESQAKKYENTISLMEERGYIANTKTYESLSNLVNSNLSLLRNERAELEAAMKVAMDSGEIEKESEAYYEMLLAIENVKEQIDEANIELIKYSNTIRDIKWSYFDYAQDKISKIVDETEFLVDLLSGSKLFDENGFLNENGLATAGLLLQKYNTYMAQADAYAKEVKEINRDLAKDPNNTDLIKRKEELISLQQKSITSAQKEKDAMVDLARDGVNAQLEALKELIDSYNDSLDSAKDLYDYQKNITKQTKKIADIEKQIAAYEGNNSEESNAKLQKLRTQLAEENENLNQTEYEKYISDQKSLLDDLYSDYEKVLNERIDDVNGLISDMIDTVNEKSNVIADTLITSAGDVGYTISNDVRSLWTEEVSGIVENVSLYSKDFSEKLNGTNQILSNIYENVSSMVSASEKAKYSDESVSNIPIQYANIATQQKEQTNSSISVASSDAIKKAVQNVSLPEYTSNNPATITGINKQAIMSGIKPTNLANGVSIGSMSVSIPIDHVESYDDLVSQMRDDKNFERLVQSMTTGLISGGSSLDKYRFMRK